MIEEPPIPIGELRESLEEAIHAMWDDAKSWESIGTSVQGWIEKHLDLEHSIPSASTVEQCILRLWYDAKKKEKDTEVPASWKSAQMIGLLSELVYVPALEHTGIELLPLKTLQFQDGLMLGTPDAISDKFTIEIKARTGWTYKRYMSRYGYVSGIEPNVYTQMQVSMDAAHVDWGLLIVLPSDFSYLQNVMRQNKRWGPEYNLSPFHLEWVGKDEAHIEYIIKRAHIIKEAIKSDEPPTREYNGIPVDFKGKKNWPCGYCPYNQRCISDNGYGDRDNLHTSLDN